MAKCSADSMERVLVVCPSELKESRCCACGITALALPCGDKLCGMCIQSMIKARRPPFCPFCVVPLPVEIVLEHAEALGMLAEVTRWLATEPGRQREDLRLCPRCQALEHDGDCASASAKVLAVL